MIDKAILDEVLPVPELETLKEEKIAELKEEGFAITNFHSGGVFYTLLLIVLRIKIEFTELLRAILNNMTLTHSTGAWLDIKAADYGKKRKKAQKARGLVTLSRTNDQGEAVKIEKGHIFKTQKDINGEELRFFAIEAAVLQKGSRSVDVLGNRCRRLHKNIIVWPGNLVNGIPNFVEKSFRRLSRRPCYNHVDRPLPSRMVTVSLCK